MCHDPLFATSDTIELSNPIPTSAYIALLSFFMDEYKQTVGVNAITTGKLKGVAIEGIAKIGDKLGGNHKEEGMIGGKLGSYEWEAHVVLLKDDAMKGSGVGESVVS
jgi:hypothetical protein